MRYLPVFLDLQSGKVLLVGAGDLARAKLRLLAAAGAQIRDRNNMVVLPTALPARSLVKFQLGADGKLNRAWILTPQETAQPDLKR